MNLTDLIAKRQQASESKLASYVFEYYRLKKRIDELDTAIIDAQATIRECEQSKRDYVTFVAVEAARESKPDPEAKKES